MNKCIEDMTFKEFSEYCNQRACDGQWGMLEAIACLGMFDEIQAVRVKFLGFTIRRATKIAREDAWEKLKLRCKEDN